MRINNTTKKCILAQEAAVADKLWQRVSGLLGKKEVAPGGGLILKPCNSIHTCFMSFPIDALFVDKRGKVVKAFSGLKPFRLTPIYFNACLVIELPAGIIQSSGTSEGDTLTLE